MSWVVEQLGEVRLSAKQVGFCEPTVAYGADLRSLDRLHVLCLGFASLGEEGLVLA
jgi:hypothetical protein